MEYFVSYHIATQIKMAELSLRIKTRIVEPLQSQHILDLGIYRSAHREWRNRLIHYVMIPVECFAIQLLVRNVAGNLINVLVASSLAILSMTVATHALPGVCSFIFHVGSSWLSHWIVTHHTTQGTIVIGMILWTGAWTIQVGIGHFLLEKNSPNVANMKTVSYLAMALSVLIAWSS